MIPIHSLALLAVTALYQSPSSHPLLLNEVRGLKALLALLLQVSLLVAVVVRAYCCYCWCLQQGLARLKHGVQVGMLC